MEVRDRLTSGVVVGGARGVGVAVTGRWEHSLGDRNVCLLTVQGVEPRGVSSYSWGRSRPQKKLGKATEGSLRSNYFLKLHVNLQLPQN